LATSTIFDPRKNRVPHLVVADAPHPGRVSDFADVGYGFCDVLRRPEDKTHGWIGSRWNALRVNTLLLRSEKAYLGWCGFVLGKHGSSSTVKKR
jgi:hypothetical protein